MQPMDVSSRCERALRAVPGLDAAGAVVVGVSGGADSLALLHLLARCGEPPLRLLAVHVHHGLRGAEADADAAFVADTAAAWNIPCRVVHVDVPGLARQARLSTEEAARRARYTALADAARAAGMRFIAVGHHADDQAETVLMHLLRGSGLAGLRGMLPVTPLSAYHLLPAVRPEGSALMLIRPLLDVPRAALESYCAAHGLSPRLDSTNVDLTYFRNRLRHEALPLLESLIPGLRERLGRTAAVLAADYAVLEAQVEAAWQQVALADSAAQVSLDRAGWRALPLALQRALIRRAVYRLRPELRDVSFEPVEGAVRVARIGEAGAEATLPAGLSLRVDYDRLILSAGEDEPPPDWPLLEPGTAMPIPGPVDLPLPGSSWRFSLAGYDGPRQGPAWKALLADPWCAVLDGAAAAPPLILRTRRPGDRFRPQGVGGSQKVADFMINARIPARWRSRLPLLVSGDGIVWVCGWRVGEGAVVRPMTGSVWLARFWRS